MELHDGFEELNRIYTAESLVKEFIDNVGYSPCDEKELGEILYELYQVKYEYAINEYRANTNYVVNNVLKDIISNGRIDIRNHTFDTIEDICALCKILRDTRYETFRIIYVKNNKVVGQDAVTSKLTGFSSIEKYHGKNVGVFNKDNLNRSVEEYKLKMKKLGADGYYLLHNHPSGNYEPSRQDVAVTEAFRQCVPGLIDHIVVGINDAYSVTTGEVYHLDDVELNKDSINTPELASAYAKMYKNKDDYSVIVYANSQHNVIAVQEIKNSELKDNNLFKWLNNERAKIGSASTFILTNDYDFWLSCDKEIVMNVLTDAFYEKENDNILSLRTINNLTPKNIDIKKSYNV